MGRGRPVTVTQVEIKIFGFGLSEPPFEIYSCGVAGQPLSLYMKYRELDISYTPTCTPMDVKNSICNEELSYTHLV